ncbi:MAG: hypothetical protein FJ405_16970, partial [Verrucomicrobia bacterium]|nr:hypothetical protein [Verrucomicrobiota bacterium]
MKTTQPFGGRPACFTALFLALVLALPLSLSGRVLDNFNDNTKTGWKDFTFITDFGLPQESDGQFKFEQPPAGQAIFSASQKISEEFVLVEGRTIEFRVDVTEMGGKDSFAVLAFIPTVNSPGTLAGYGLARSITDVLITKGINKYFRADAGAAAALPRNANTTMVLSMTVKGGSVHITASILDKEDGDKVIWTSTVVDTPGADVLVAGSDSPAAPYITKGYFTLYLYQDFDRGAPENPYKASYDNAEVFVNDTTVLDNFDDGAKTGWTDFTFVPGLGIPSELEGQFRFEMPPAGQAIFSASQKTSRLFELKEGERTEFRVDIIEGGKKDSFAVLAFLPQANSPGTLAGYGLAKSTTDVLITKGINRYFVNDASAPSDMENVTLSLGMEVKNGNVIVTARVLEIQNDNRVRWERIVVDTPNADVLV